MKPLTLEEIVTASEGIADRSALPGSANRVVIDSREVRPGDLFVAIHGERFDGHDYVAPAFQAGAVAAMVRQDYAPNDDVADIVSGGALIRVDDPVTALGRLARYYRRRVLGRSSTVVAVTGSNGKTTTKTMIAHVLSGRMKGLASIKSYNNAIGVPLTLLAADPSDAFVICEVGMNAPGEIAALAALVEPEIAVVTGISEAHLERLGSLEAIAAEKMSLLLSLPEGGCAVVNAEHELIRRKLESDPAFKSIRRVTYGRWEKADLRLTSGDAAMDTGYALDPPPRSSPPAGGEETQSFTVNGRFHYRLNVPGRHNVFNALAAIGVARRFGVDHEEIAARLESFELPAMRLQRETIGPWSVINDAYNANPASLAAALDVLTAMPATRRVLIVGDMRELGDAAERLHRDAAGRIGRSNVDLVVSVGKFARLIGRTVRSASSGRVETHAYAGTALARRRLLSHLRPGDTVLLKGSRALALEKLVEVMRDQALRAPKSLPRRRPVQRKRQAPVGKARL